jgi:hypothetical protein
MTAPEAALHALAGAVRAERTVISERVVDPAAEPTLGLLVAAGPRAAGAPGEYAWVIEAIREGYLLHYGEPRIVVGADHDLALLAGDYLYALGLDRLAGLGDLDAVVELADLISLQAQLHADPDVPPANGRKPPPAAAPLWLASAVSVAAGSLARYEAAKRAAREGRPEAADLLHQAAASGAARAGLEEAFGRSAEAMGSPPLK